MPDGAFKFLFLISCFLFFLNLELNRSCLTLFISGSHLENQSSCYKDAWWYFPP